MHIAYARCQTSRNKDGHLAQNIPAVISDRKQVFTALILALATQLKGTWCPGTSTVQLLVQPLGYYMITTANITTRYCYYSL